MEPTIGLDSVAFWQRAVDLAVAAACDRAAAEKLCGHLRPWVLRLVAAQFPYRGDAEDVTQETILAVFNGVGKLDDPERVRSWVAAIALNQTRNFYRRQSREAIRLGKLHNGRRPTEEAPERTSIIGGMKVDLFESLDRLEPQKAFALALRQFGLPYEAIAGEMSSPEHLATHFPDRQTPIPVGTVKRWVSEARTEMRRHMSETD